MRECLTQPCIMHPIYSCQASGSCSEIQIERKKEKNRVKLPKKRLLVVEL